MFSGRIGSRDVISVHVEQLFCSNPIDCERAIKAYTALWVNANGLDTNDFFV